MSEPSVNLALALVGVRSKPLGGYSPMVQGLEGNLRTLVSYPA